MAVRKEAGRRYAPVRRVLRGLLAFLREPPGASRQGRSKYSARSATSFSKVTAPLVILAPWVLSRLFLLP